MASETSVFSATGLSFFFQHPNFWMNCDVGFLFYFEKMIFLDFFDMYLLIFDINSQYLVRFSPYFVTVWVQSQPLERIVGK